MDFTWLSPVQIHALGRKIELLKASAQGHRALAQQLSTPAGPLQAAEGQVLNNAAPATEGHRDDPDPDRADSLPQRKVAALGHLDEAIGLQSQSCTVRIQVMRI